MKNSNFHTIGVMSGTSLDGLDVAYCTFTLREKKWIYEILKAKTFQYDDAFKNKLSQIHLSGAEEISFFDINYGRWIGDKINDFIKENSIEKIDLIASHGHTVFHQPEKNFTLQIGDGNAIAATTGATVVFNFRSLDVALGGQGAPLVPIGDELLFSDYDFCLNLGGFANISFKEKGKRTAFDISPVNIFLNFLANKAGSEFDDDGKIAASGQVIPALLNTLNDLDFYKMNHPKSLGREWFENEIIPLLDTKTFSLADLINTGCEHIAEQISIVINKNSNPDNSVFVTGGGAFNSFLIDKIKSKTKAQIVIPGTEIINYKEALVFAFLGVLRINNKINVLSGVTGASADSCSGVVVAGNDFKRN